MGETTSRKYHVHGKYYYREIITQRGSVVIDCEIDAANADEAMDTAIDEAMSAQALIGDDWEEYRSDVKAEVITLTPEEQERAESVARERWKAAVGAPALFPVEEYAR
jgi:hypothetical protein